VRRPGRWETIRENLAAMGELSRAGTFRRNRFSGERPSATSELSLSAEHPLSFVLAFVVQRANFREMPDFVRLAEEVAADCVVFQKYYSFGHENADVFSIKDVTSPHHPDHQALKDVLADPAIAHPIVAQTFLSQIAS
jgi:hypothetical protein